MDLSFDSGKIIYLDNAATTFPKPREVLQQALDAYAHFGVNPGRSGYDLCMVAGELVFETRKVLATFLGGTKPERLVFAANATDALNLAIQGLLQSGDHAITTTVEHNSVIRPLNHLKRDRGVELDYVPFEAGGIVDPDEIARRFKPNTKVVVVNHGSNVIGTIQPVAEIGAICRERGVFFHCDAAQGFGKIPIDVEADHIDLMSLSAHKMYGPKGIGALYIRRRAPRVALAAQMDGGGHECGFRSGTLNVPAIVGFGVACAIARREMAEEAARTGALRDRLLAQLEAALDGVAVNGSRTRRLPGNLNVSFPGVEGDTLLLSLPDIALSTGSACSSASVEPSHVLKALGVGPWRERSAVRFGLGRFTTAEEIDYTAARVVEAVRRLRSLAPGGV